jgi:hypothetical protein
LKLSKIVRISKFHFFVFLINFLQDDPLSVNRSFLRLVCPWFQSSFVLKFIPRIGPGSVSTTCFQILATIDVLGVLVKWHWDVGNSLHVIRLALKVGTWGNQPSRCLKSTSRVI